MKKRVISAIVIIAIFLPFLIIGELPFAIFMSVLSVMGLYELLKVREEKKKFPLSLKIIAFILTVYFCLYNTNSIESFMHLDYRVMSTIIFLFLWLYSFVLP